MYSTYMPAHGGQMRVSDALELELWVFVSRCGGLGTEPGSPTRAAGALNLQANAPVPVSVLSRIIK